MTDHSQSPDTDLPRFPVHVVPTDQIRSQHLRALLENFRSQESDPLIFGDDGHPEAAVIPFSAFVRLMRHDHAAHVRAEDAFQSELAERVKDSDATRASGQEPGLVIETDEDLYAWAASLGQAGAEWAQAQRARDEGSGHEE